MRKWEAIFTDADRAVLKAFGRGGRQPFGKRPALVIVDVVKAFIGSKPESTLESAEEYRTSCGEAGWAALQYIRKLLEAFRARELPVVYTTVDPAMERFAWGADKWSGPTDKCDDFKAWEVAEDKKP